MADLSNEIATIKSALYGKEIRESLVSGFTKLSGGEDTWTTSEMATGSNWIDNKPIYRCIVKLNQQSSGASSWNFLPISVDTLIKIYGYVKSQENRIYPFPYASVDNANNSITGDIDSSGSTMTVYTGSNATIASGYAILEYTKK